MNSNKKTARLAGLLYLIISFVAPYSLMFVPSQIFVKGDATATANNILANEFLFRSGIAVDSFHQVILLLVVWVLFRLLKQVNEHQAKLMIIFVAVGIPISFIANVFKITALMILKGGLLESFEPEQIQDLVVVLLKTSNYGTHMVQLYWGLWLIPFGLLVYKSEFIPRIFGVFLILNGIAYIILSFIFQFFPDYSEIAFTLSMPFLLSGELPIMLWFLIKGVKVKRGISEV